MDIKIISADDGATAYRQWNEALKGNITEEYLMFTQPGTEGEKIAALPMAEEMAMAGADMVTAGYTLCYGDEILQESPEKVRRVFSGEDMLCRIFYLQNEQGFVFNKLFRTDIIKRFKLKFRTNIGAGAERLFLVNYLKRAELVSMLPDHLMKWDLNITPPGYDKDTRKAFSIMRRALFFYGDAKYLCKMDMDYLKEEITEDEEV